MERSGVSKRIGEIDGLRAVAMSMVIAQHCSILPFGWVGVWIFFVISGYVISLSLLTGRNTSFPASTRYKLFVIRRFLRIVPVYLLYIVLNAMLLAVLGKWGAFRDMPYLLSFTYNWQMIYEFWPTGVNWSSFGHLWTLSIEEQFYLFYPFIVLWLSRRRYLIAAIALIAVGPLIRFLVASLSASVSDDTGWIAFSVYASSICQFDAFLAGAVMAFFREKLEVDRKITYSIVSIAAVVSIVYVVTYVSLNLASGARGVDALRNIYSGILYGQGREVFVYSSVTLLAAAIMALVIARHPSVRPLGWGPLVYVGKISYGGYLYHALILFVIGSVLLDGANVHFSIAEKLLFFAFIWLLTVMVASASFRYFEQRFLDRSEVISSRIVFAAANGLQPVSTSGKDTRDPVPASNAGR
ncbi:MAG: acyltransferase family protein [Phyllobacterium sp.]